MADIDLSSYQTKETAWRWESRRQRAIERVQEAQEKLSLAEAELRHLEAHPPMYELMNWSA